MSPPSSHSSSSPDPKLWRDDDWEKDDYLASFDFYPAPNSWYRKFKHPWTACLIVRSKELPRLMREGIFWTAENIHPNSDNFVKEESAKKSAPELCWSGHRTFCLSSSEKQHKNLETVASTAATNDAGEKGHGYGDCSSSDSRPLWVGKLVVFAENLSHLGNFRPAQQLRTDMIQYASAWSPTVAGQFYYKFDREQPELNFNTLLDNTPVAEGWPKIEDTEAGDSGTNSRMASTGLFSFKFGFFAGKHNRTVGTGQFSYEFGFFIGI